MDIFNEYLNYRHNVRDCHTDAVVYVVKKGIAEGFALPYESYSQLICARLHEEGLTEQYLDATSIDRNGYPIP